VTTLIPLTNTPRDYAWGAVDGVSHALGWAPSGGPEAELWLGAHPLSPSRPTVPTGWRDLAAWERDAPKPLPFLLKVLSAASPLSLQAHPTPAQARAGFAREEAAGIPRDAPERNYKDPNAKPELIVAVDDGFEALCGFRAVDETLAAIAEFAALSDDPVLDRWRVQTERGVREAFTWLLSGDGEVDRLVTVVTELAAEHPDRFELVGRIAAGFPGDPGLLVALMLNQVTLDAGQALWLPAGNIHAYLRGTGIELMGPSDNVLRGGLTPKHVDRGELQSVLDFTPGPAPFLVPVPVGENVSSYRPASVPSGAGVGFELLLVTGDADIRTESAAIALTVDGDFRLEDEDGATRVARGSIVFADEPARLHVAGAGRLFVATGL
jgi:mannose-6-phosphate isomerase